MSSLGFYIYLHFDIVMRHCMKQSLDAVNKDSGWMFEEMTRVYSGSPSRRPPSLGLPPGVWTGHEVVFCNVRVRQTPVELMAKIYITVRPMACVWNHTFLWPFTNLESL